VTPEFVNVNLGEFGGILDEESLRVAIGIDVLFGILGKQ